MRWTATPLPRFNTLVDVIRPLLILTVVLVASASEARSAESCSGVRRVIVGCTVGCGKAFKEAISRAAGHVKVRVGFANLFPDRTKLETALERVDAIVSPGGTDIDPLFYLPSATPDDREKLKSDYARLGKHNEFSPERDAFEYELFRKLLGGKRYGTLPVLGVCYGMQMLSVASGLPLVIDIHERFAIPNRYGLKDQAEIEPGTTAESIFRHSTVSGLELHHQAVDIEAYRKLAHPRFRISAVSNGGRIPEVIEYLDRPVVGLQFHPEQSEAQVGDAIFEWLLTKACEHRLRPVPSQP